MLDSSDTKDRNYPINTLNIQPIFDYPIPSERLDVHIQLIEKTLLSIIPDHLLYKSHQEIKNWMQSSIPFIKWSDCKSSPDCLTIYLLSTPIKEIKTQNFFIDLLKRWLIYNKEIDIISHWSMRFHFPGEIDTVYFVSEVNILVESGQDLETMQNNLPLISKELISGIQSWKYAKYILENKNLLYDRKVSLTNQDLIRLLEKRPDYFDFSIFTEINRFLALTTEIFRKQRPYRHITRLACSLYLLRKTLRRWLSTFPEKRHLYIRFVPTTLKFTFGNKPVLGLVIGVNLFDQHEFFSEKHIVAGVKKFIPEIQAVKSTFYSYQEPRDNIRTIYFEIEKKDGKKFYLEEIKDLKKNLTDELKGHIEKLIPALFLTRNEEETMRNILMLSQELKYVSDFPQIHISFEYQSIEHLTFTVVLVRICKPHTEPVEKLLKAYNPDLNFIIERTQTIGFLRKRYPKEANVFRIKIEKTDSFIRKDSSVNLLVARKTILETLEGAFGQVRDFNGGMLLKQAEAFSHLKKLYPKITTSKQDLLETFFYSINPIELQTRLDPQLLKSFSKLFLDQLNIDLDKKDSYLFEIIEEKKHLLVMIRAFETKIRQEIQKALGTKKFSIISTQVNFQGTFSLGFIFPAKEQKDKKYYISLLKKAIFNAFDKAHSYQKLRFNFYTDLFSLDPRMGGDEESKVILKLLFEGLIRLDKTGTPQLGLAESYKLSEDKKSYTFILRKSFWSDGSELCAYDFEYAWKKILSPEFQSHFTFLFYPIKNARRAKKADVSLDEVGIKAINKNTLVIDLEHPAPYFFEFLALPLFSPINHKHDQMHPNWVTQDGKEYVCNGPFIFEKIQTDGYCLKKNPLYWNHKTNHLQEINIIKTTPSTALDMLKNNELDSISIPHSFYKHSENKYNFNKTLSEFKNVEILLFNTNKFPLQNKNIRKALSLSINRKFLLQKAKLSCHPTNRLLFHNEKSSINNVQLAQAFFLKGLKELNIDIKRFPVLTLIYYPIEKRSKTAILLKQIWKQVLGIECRIEEYERKILFDNLTKGEFQLNISTWTSSVRDPIYTLNGFRHKEDLIDFSNWESKEFQDLLHKADLQSIPTKRDEILKEAEDLLLDNVPVLPLFYDHDIKFSNKSKKSLYEKVF